MKASRLKDNTLMSEAIKQFLTMANDPNVCKYIPDPDGELGRYAIERRKWLDCVARFRAVTSKHEAHSDH